MATVMTSAEFVKKLKRAATDYKTLYVMGCFGAPMSAANKKRYTANHSYNKATTRTAMINAASADTFGFDCVCLIKGILWGWSGDKNKTYGGAAYASNGVPDIGADQMIKVCSDVSTDFSNLIPGEAVWLEGHIGVYIGDGLAVECTPRWGNKVQITACNCTKSGYNRRNWTKHGKLPYIDYTAKAEPTPEPTASFSAEGIDVSKWQGDIDFTKVKAAGKSFVIARAGIGLTTDPYWEANYKKAKAAGLDVGAYWAHDSGSGDTAERALAEANACIALLKGKQLELPVYYDLEVGDSSKWNAMAYAFCQAVEAAGYFVGLYTSESFLKSFDAGFKTRFTLWVANWSKKPATGAIWQKSSKGSVPGISGDVDLDTAYQDFPTAIKAAKLNGYGSKVTEDEDSATAPPTASTEPSQPDDDSARILDLATRVIHGEFGNGATRKAKLGNDYAAVQAEVNHRLTASIDELAKEVIAGRYGNGQAREYALAYRYSAVQKRVNQLLK